MTSSPSVECGECARLLDEPTNLDPKLRQPCPSCGSRRRLIKVYVEDKIDFHESLRFVQKGDRLGVRGRRLVEGRVGDSQSADGTWAQEDQLVDRINRRYRKRVVTSDGRVVRDVDKPLEEHIGRGTAKPHQK